MASSPQPGDIVLERFRLERPLASGAMGDVWAARMVGSKDRVAVKLARGDGLRRAEREASALAMLDHPGVVRHIDHGPHEESFALVMEMLDGVPLSQRVQARNLDVATVLKLSGEIADALVHAHSRGVVHRDVKASNVLVVKRQGSEEAVLIDFGLGLVEGSPRLSSADVVLGSSHTMPPEQVQGLTAGPRADVYSLGALMFRLVCGQYPFHASSPVQVLAMHAHAKVPRFGQRTRWDTRVPAGLEDLVAACLGKDPDGRPDASTVAERLVALAAVPEARWIDIPMAEGMPPDPDGSASSMVQPAPSRTWRWVALAAGALGLAGLAIYLWM